MLSIDQELPEAMEQFMERALDEIRRARAAHARAEREACWWKFWALAIGGAGLVLAIAFVWMVVG